MAITRQKKEKLAEDLDKIVKGANAVVFVNFRGLNVADTTTMRSNLRKEGVGYKVAKKTLLERVLGTTKVEGTMPELSGELAVAYSDNSLAPAREVFVFKKTHDDNISILGGVFEGKYMTKEEMTALAAIPPIKVLLGQFVNLINSPIQGFAVALNAIAEKKQ